MVLSIVTYTKHVVSYASNKSYIIAKNVQNKFIDDKAINIGFLQHTMDYHGLEKQSCS